MTDTLSFAFSLLAVIVSIVTLYLTLLRRGTIKATKPRVIYFGPDSKSSKLNKIYMRFLLFSTAKRGRIIESLFVRLSRSETSQCFPIWVYGEESLKRGSGLFIPYSGLTLNHHFLLPSDGTAFKFLPGAYTINLLASMVGEKKHKCLLTVVIDLSNNEANELREGDKGIYYDLGYASKKYTSHVRKIENDTYEEMLKALKPFPKE